MHDSADLAKRTLMNGVRLRQVAICVPLVFVALAACGSDGSPESESTDEAAVAAGESAGDSTGEAAVSEGESAGDSTDEAAVSDSESTGEAAVADGGPIEELDGLSVEELAELSFEELDALLESKWVEFDAAQTAWEVVFDELYGGDAPSDAKRDELETELSQIEATLDAITAEIDRIVTLTMTAETGLADATDPTEAAGLTREEEALLRAARMEELLARDDLTELPQAELTALLDELAGPYTPEVLVYGTPCSVGDTFDTGEGCHIVGHGHFYVNENGFGVFTPDAYTVHGDAYGETTATPSLDEALDEVFYETSIARPARPGDRFAAETNDEGTWTVTALP